MATHVSQHKCDQWVSADADLVTKDLPWASQPQAILKLHPPCSLDYKAHQGPQTGVACISTEVFQIVKRQRFQSLFDFDSQNRESWHFTMQHIRFISRQNIFKGNVKEF